MPRDILTDSLAVLRIIEHDDEENWPLDEREACKPNKHISNSGRYQLPKDDCACYYNFALGESINSRQHDPIYQYKTSSLPPAASLNQSWDQVICSALRIAPEDIANQLTLLDLDCFKSIRPEELTSCGWNKSQKLTIAPNIVAFTKRFNRVSFWTVQEILNGSSPKTRADVMAHFIKVGKKLHELNSLHSLFAVISALQSASIYRLAKTWSSLSKRDKQQFDKLAELFADNNNWMALRDYLRSISLPCVPYLGIFLTDLVYIDIAHPAGSPHRVTKMAAVLKALQRYQESEYNIPPLPHVAEYLNSVRYIEELQKFVEDDQYKLSLKLEPPSPVGSCVGSKESVNEGKEPITPYNLSPSHRLGSGSLRIHTTSSQNKFIPTHRKCRSLGSNIFGKCPTDEKSEEKTPAGSVNLLDDTLLESPSTVPRGHFFMTMPLPTSVAPPDGSICDYEGFVRRKTLLKNGRKPSISSWQRYWLQITNNVLSFYGSKSFKGCQRSDFRCERCKLLCLDGWSAAAMAPATDDAFQLTNHQTATVYKFKVGSESSARQWVSKISDVTDKTIKPLPVNLMTFE